MFRGFAKLITKSKFNFCFHLLQDQVTVQYYSVQGFSLAVQSVINGFPKDSKFDRLALRGKWPIFFKLAQGTNVLSDTQQESYQNILF